MTLSFTLIRAWKEVRVLFSPVKGNRTRSVTHAAAVREKLRD